MIKHSIAIEDILTKLKPSRKLEKSIMSYFSDSSNDSTAVKNLNLYLQFLNVTTLENISSTDGSAVYMWAWEGTKLDGWLNKPSLKRNSEGKN